MKKVYVVSLEYVDRATKMVSGGDNIFEQKENANTYIQNIEKVINLSIDKDEFVKTSYIDVYLREVIIDNDIDIDINDDDDVEYFFDFIFNADDETNVIQKFSLFK